MFTTGNDVYSDTLQQKHEEDRRAITLVRDMQKRSYCHRCEAADLVTNENVVDWKEKGR
jgi:hypothetical protein